MDEEKSTETNVKVSSSGNVIVFPDFEKLKSEVEKMRTELSMLLLERDELQFVICKNIETEYMLKLGSIEYKASETTHSIQDNGRRGLHFLHSLR